MSEANRPQGEMGTDHKAGEKPQKPPVVLPPRSKIARNVRLLVLSLVATALSVVFAIAFILSALVALSVLFNRDAFGEIRTFINDHPREEVNRIVCMIVPIIASCLILCAFPITQRIPPSLTGVPKTKTKFSRKEHLVLVVIVALETGLGSWSSWRQYQELVAERFGKSHHLFGKRAEEAFL